MPQLTPLAALFLVVAILDGDPAEAAQAWDATQATQGLVVLGGFTVALFAGLVLLARTMARVLGHPRIGVTELKYRLDAAEDILVLDVRTRADFVGEQGHIAGATNIPLEELESRLIELPGGANRPIALVCRTDRRSDKAAALLARHGVRGAVVVRGGMTGWLANGWPVEDAHPGQG